MKKLVIVFIFLMVGFIGIIKSSNPIPKEFLFNPQKPKIPSFQTFVSNALSLKYQSITQSLNNLLQMVNNFLFAHWKKITIVAGTAAVAAYLAINKYKKKKEIKEKEKEKLQKNQVENKVNNNPVYISLFLDHIKFLINNKINNIYDPNDDISNQNKEEAAKPVSFIDKINTDFHCIKFELIEENKELINKNKDDKDDKDFFDIVLAMASVSQLLSIIYDYYNHKINKKLSNWNIATIELLIALISVFENKITEEIKKIDTTSIKKISLTQLVDALKKHYLYYEVQKNNYQLVSEFKNHDEQFDIEKTIYPQPQNQEEAEKAGFIFFLERLYKDDINKGPLYKFYNFKQEIVNGRLDQIFKEENSFFYQAKRRNLKELEIKEINQQINQNLQEWIREIPFNKLLNRIVDQPNHHQHDLAIILANTQELQ